MRPRRDPILEREVAAQRLSALARAVGVTVQAASQWLKIPPARVLAAEAFLGVSRHELRPDIYGPVPSATSNASPDDSSPHAGGPSPDPIPEISESPQPGHGSGERSVVAAPEGAA